jgi:nitrite reductase/ring-hydroxylating ferredoxin subunit
MILNDEDDESERSPTTRRTFCAELMLTSAGLVLVGPNLTRAKASQGSEVAYPPRRIEGAESLLPGSCLYFDYPTTNDPAVLLRSNEGEYRAYSRRCSHAGCSVDFDPSNKCLKCPCHRGTFDPRFGYVMFGPPRRPLDEIILQMRAGGQLWATGKSFGREREVITRALVGGD